jgi:hypothetical protein
LVQVALEELLLEAFKVVILYFLALHPQVEEVEAQNVQAILMVDLVDLVVELDTEVAEMLVVLELQAKETTVAILYLQEVAVVVALVLTAIMVVLILAALVVLEQHLRIQVHL